MPMRAATLLKPPSGTLPSGSPDVRRALAAGFTQDEVVYMFALDVPDTTEVQIDEDEPRRNVRNRTVGG
jgi:hypothetical protein